jgi:hypothetical protein
MTRQEFECSCECGAKIIVELQPDGEIYIEIAGKDCGVAMFLKRQDALELISHLAGMLLNDQEN